MCVSWRAAWAAKRKHGIHKPCLTWPSHVEGENKYDSSREENVQSLPGNWSFPSCSSLKPKQPNTPTRRRVWIPAQLTIVQGLGIHLENVPGLPELRLEISVLPYTTAGWDWEIHHFPPPPFLNVSLSAQKCCPSAWLNSFRGEMWEDTRKFSAINREVSSVNSCTG